MSTPVRINEWKMRWLFKRHRFLEKVKSGELTEQTTRDTHPTRTVAAEPFCTRTQEVSYLDSTRNEVARVHQYLRRDGTIGATGRPDPKRLVIRGQLYRMHRGDANLSRWERTEAWV